MIHDNITNNLTSIALLIFLATFSRSHAMMADELKKKNNDTTFLKTEKTFVYLTFDEIRAMSCAMEKSRKEKINDRYEQGRSK